MELTMERRKITAGGQVSIPAAVRRRWATDAVIVDDLGDHLVVRPLPADPIAAARGSLKGLLPPTERLRTQARADEEQAERRRWSSSTPTRS
jgi:bifunctional DNA-binding transcriptional regulator/antitoxin component of YhaV-PrlF toxin-antitoxin module